MRFWCFRKPQIEVKKGKLVGAYKRSVTYKGNVANGQFDGECKVSIIDTKIDTQAETLISNKIFKTNF